MCVCVCVCVCVCGRVCVYVRARALTRRAAPPQVAALTPKGRELMQGLFPADHFAAKMTMRQLVFSVEGSYSSYCSCDSCLRCRTAVERLHRQSHAGKGHKGGGAALGDGCAGRSRLPAPHVVLLTHKTSACVGEWFSRCV